LTRSSETAISAPDPGDLSEGLARVVTATPEAAVLEAQARSACGPCAQAETCGVSSLAEVFGRRPVRFRLPNDFDARTGEWVVVAVPQTTVLRASLYVYVLPVLGLLAFALIGAGAGDAAAAGMGAGGLVAGLSAGRWLSRRALSAERLRPRVLRRAAAPGENAAGCTTDRHAP
jgi:sigma-E factor negative regulatory protein RseC